MLVKLFERAEDQDYGGEGWLPLWMEGANTMNGGGCAHDILEHHPNMPLGAEAEFHALGASYWIRGETGWFFGRNIYSAEGNYAHDFPPILERVQYETETLKRPPHTLPLSADLYGDAEDALREIIQKGISLTRKERACSDEKLYLPHDARQRILGWMRLGYRYAARRYGMGNNFAALDMFNSIERQVNEHGKHADLGMQMKVSVNIRQNDVTVKSYYPGREDY